MVPQKTMKDRLVNSLSDLNFNREGNFFSSLREESRKQLAELHVPGGKDESWRYTPLNKITDRDYLLGELTDIQIDEFIIPGIEIELLVLVNGIFSKSLSVFNSSNELFISSLNEAKEQEREALKKHFTAHNLVEGDFFRSLNSSFHRDGVYIEVARNYCHDKIIHILNVVSGNGIISQPKSVILANEGSNIKLIESSVVAQGKGNFTNSVFELVLHENSSLEYNKLQDQRDGNFQISTDHVWQYGNSNFNVNTMVFDGELVRNSLYVEIDGENCEANLNGLYLGKENNHIGNHTIIDHIKPHSNSNEIYKGILDDNSMGVFDGKVFVRPHAQVTNAFQENNNLLLTDTAGVNSKPALEIYADDVKCSHGSTTGQIDEDALFYLRSRGISRENSMNLMIIAFAERALEGISIECLLDYVEKKIEERFRK